jgi:hypothetical protein
MAKRIMTGKSQSDRNQSAAELQAEIARLREQLAVAKSSEKVMTVTEGEYKGSPTLTFEGAFKPFTLGLGKLATIVKASKEIAAFVQKHGK